MLRFEQSSVFELFHKNCVRENYHFIINMFVRICVPKNVFPNVRANEFWNFDMHWNGIRSLGLNSSYHSHFHPMLDVHDLDMDRMEAIDLYLFDLMSVKQIETDDARWLLIIDHWSFDNSDVLCVVANKNEI